MKSYISYISYLEYLTHKGPWDGVAGESLSRLGILKYSLSITISENMTFARKKLFSFGLKFHYIVLTDIKYLVLPFAMLSPFVVNSHVIFSNN